LIHTKLCCLLLIETRFDVKSQFECRVTYECNHIFRNSTKHHRRYFEKQISYIKKCSKLIHEISWALDESHDFHDSWIKWSWNFKVSWYTIKNIATACGISWFVNKMIKVSSNFMDKVLKLIKLDEYHFPTYFTSFFMHLQFKFDLYRKNSLSDT
jgi:hypothetical protein